MAHKVATHIGSATPVGLFVDLYTDVPLVNIVELGNRFRIREPITNRLVPPRGLEPFMLVGVTKTAIELESPQLPDDMLPYSVPSNSEIWYAEDYEMYTEDTDMELVVIETALDDD
jgi:hypothetical protein